MKKLLLGLLLFILCINVNAKELTFDVCDSGFCNFKNIDDALTRAEDYNSTDIITIILKDDYKEYELTSHDINSEIIIKNRPDKKLDLIEIKGKSDCTIKLKHSFSFTNSFNNKNGEVDIQNVTFTTDEFRGDKELVILEGNFVMTNINIDGFFKWEDYLRTLNNPNRGSYDELNGIAFNNSRIEIDGLNINNCLTAINNNNSNLIIKNSDISQNVYSIHSYSGDITLDYIKLNSMIIGEKQKSKLNITGTSEFNNTVKFYDKIAFKSYDLKDYSNIFLLNKSTYTFNLEATKNISINSRGQSLKRVFPVIDGLNYEKIKWKSNNEAIAKIENNRVVPIAIGETTIESIVNDNIKFTITIKVNEKSKSFPKYIIVIAVIIVLVSIFMKKDKDNE